MNVAAHGYSGTSARMQPAVVAGLGKRLRTWTMTIQATLARYLADAGSRRL